MKTQLYKSIFSLALVLMCTTMGLLAQQKESEEVIKDSHLQLEQAMKEVREQHKQLIASQRKLSELRRELDRHEIRKAVKEARREAQDMSHYIERSVEGSLPRPFHGDFPSFPGEAFQNSDDDSGAGHSRDNIEKTKKISKSYQVKSSDLLSISNKFGKVHVNTWNKNEIVVEVAMIARAEKEQQAQQLLDKITIRADESKGGVISYVTELESMINRGKRSMEVNYTVFMPKSNPLTVKNNFGDIYVADLNGKADLEVKYGSLKTERLNNSENTIKVAFGSGDVPYMKNGKLDISYSKFNLGSGGNVVLNNGFSEIVVGKTQNLELKSRYGNIQIDHVDNIQGSVGFSGFNLNKLNDKIEMKVQYCSNFVIDEIGKNFSLISLDGKFSSFNLNFEPNTNFDFNTDLKFGDLHANENQVNFTLVEKKNTHNNYKGTYGKAKSSSQVKISSQYGDVKFSKK